MIVHALRRDELVELMLREIRDLDALGARDRAVERREPAGEQLREVDLPLPFGPSSAMRSSVSMRSVSRRSTGLPGS